MSGLTQRDGIWHINKVFKGERIYQSTGTGSLEEAEQILIHLLDQRRQQQLFGVRQVKTWRDAATRYLLENQDMPSIGLTATYLEQLDPFIGELPVTHIDDDALEPFRQWMREGGKMASGKTKKPSSPRTINIALQRVVRILHLCARTWRDANKRAWIDVVPAITMEGERGRTREPYPMDWDEQRLLFAELPDYLERMALFNVNSGAREQEVCKLRWDWEVKVPELGTSVFIVPPEFGGRSEQAGVKNREYRVLVLNDVARSVIEGQRGLCDEWVFPYGDEGGPLHRMNATAWRSARNRAADAWQAEFGKPARQGFKKLRVHDLKHTFGRRLRAAGVPKEDRQALLGHKSDSVTTHYSAAELEGLIAQANKVSTANRTTPTLTILRTAAA
jgi:integrase